eukprot:460115-Rhodomonas_salina.1
MLSPRYAQYCLVTVLRAPYGMSGTATVNELWVCCYQAEFDAKRADYIASVAEVVQVLPAPIILHDVRCHPMSRPTRCPVSFYTCPMRCLVSSYAHPRGHRVPTSAVAVGVPVESETRRREEEEEEGKGEEERRRARREGGRERGRERRQSSLRKLLAISVAVPTVVATDSVASAPSATAFQTQLSTNLVRSLRPPYAQSGYAAT